MSRPTSELIADLLADTPENCPCRRCCARRAGADRLAQFDAIEARLNTELATAYNKISELNTENERLRYSKASG